MSYDGRYIQHPPVLISVTPFGCVMEDMIRNPFKQTAKKIMQGLFNFRKIKENEFCFTHPKAGTMALDDYKSIVFASQIGFGEWIDVANLSDLMFNHQENEGKIERILRLETDQFTVELNNFENAFDFIHDIIGEWEDWGKPDA